MATTFGDVALWILGFTYVILGIQHIFTEPIAGVILVVVGFFGFPPVYKELTAQYDIEITPYAVLGIVILLGLFAFGMN